MSLGLRRVGPVLWGARGFRGYSQALKPSHAAEKRLKFYSHLIIGHSKTRLAGSRLISLFYSSSHVSEVAKRKGGA